MRPAFVLFIDSLTHNSLSLYESHTLCEIPFLPIRFTTSLSRWKFRFCSSCVCVKNFLLISRMTEIIYTVKPLI